MKRGTEEAPRQVQPFARRTRGEVAIMRERLTHEYMVSIGKEAGDKATAEDLKGLADLFDAAGVGLDLKLDELPTNRADRRRMIKGIDDPNVRSIRRQVFGSYRRRRHGGSR